MNPQTHPDESLGNEAASRSLSLSDRVRTLRLPQDQSQAARTSPVGWLVALLFAATTGYLGYMVYTRPAEGIGQATAASPAAQSPGETPVGATSPQRPAGRVVLEAGGYVIPVRRAKVSPKVGGEVLELFIEEGMRVKKGDVIARLDRTKLEFEYRRLAALAETAKADYEKQLKGNRPQEIAAAEASLRESEEMRDQLRDEVGRLRRSRLVTPVDELIRVESRLSQADFRVRQLQEQYELMKAGYREEDIARAKAAYEQAVAQRDSAKYDLDNTEVVAPVTGVILAKRAEVGDTVRPEAFSNGLSASLCEMADLRNMEVDVDISERDLIRVHPGQKCEIRTEAFPDRMYQGVVDRLMPEANRSKASVSTRVRIIIPEDDNLLRPEMRARVSFLNDEETAKKAEPKSKTN